MDSVTVVHPFDTAPPKLVQSDRRARSVLDFRQVRHSEALSTTIMFVRAMIVIAFVVVMVFVWMRPRGKRIRKAAPRPLAGSDFVIGQQATIELILQLIPTDTQCHDCK